VYRVAETLAQGGKPTQPNELTHSLGFQRRMSHAAKQHYLQYSVYFLTKNRYLGKFKVPLE